MFSNLLKLGELLLAILQLLCLLDIGKHIKGIDKRIKNTDDFDFGLLDDLKERR